MIEKIATANEEGIRADRFVRIFFPSLSFGLLQKSFRQKKIIINGHKVDASTRVHQGDVVKIFLQFQNNTQQSKNDKLFHKLRPMIIFENENFLAINKPEKLSVQGGSKVKISVDDMLRAAPNKHYFLVHRIDKDTSGILLIAKNRLWASKLTQMFRENRVKKTYLAVVDGKIIKNGTIDNYLCTKDNIFGEVHAITNYKPIKRIGYYTLLQLNPLTGRKHQLRVHCAENLHSPILGDVKYNKNVQHSHLFLHAYKVILIDLGLEIVAPLPKYFTDL